MFFEEEREILEVGRENEEADDDDELQLLEASASSPEAAAASSSSGFFSDSVMVELSLDSPSAPPAPPSLLLSSSTISPDSSSSSSAAAAAAAHDSFSTSAVIHDHPSPSSFEDNYLAHHQDPRSVASLATQLQRQQHLQQEHSSDGSENNPYRFQKCLHFLFHFSNLPTPSPLPISLFFFSSEYEFEGYDNHPWTLRHLFYWLCVLFSAGILWIVTYWLPELAVRIAFPTADLSTAPLLLARLIGQQRSLTSCLTRAPGSSGSSSLHVCPVDTVPVSLQGSPRLHHLRDVECQPGIARLVTVAHQRYFYSALRRTYLRVPLAAPMSRAEAAMCAEGQSAGVEGLALGGGDEVETLLALYGRNEMRVEMPSVVSLLLREVLHPFYIFQLLSITLWLIEDYWGYAVVILVAATGSAASTVHEIRVNSRRLRDMAAMCFPVHVLRQNSDGNSTDALFAVQEVMSVELVPGDLILLEDRMALPCDVQAMGADPNVVVNEAMLT